MDPGGPPPKVLLEERLDALEYRPELLGARRRDLDGEALGADDREVVPGRGAVGVANRLTRVDEPCAADVEVLDLDGEGAAGPGLGLPDGDVVLLLLVKTGTRGIVRWVLVSKGDNIFGL